jgi:hypothetical protein
VLRSDHLQHLVIGAAVVAVIGGTLAACGVPGAALVGWALAVGAFYGREQRDAELHWQAASRENLATAESRWRVWLPWKWNRDGRWDFGCPLVSATATACIVEALHRALGV